MNKKTKKREFPNTFVIIFIIVLLCAVATWFVPGGKYVTSNGVVEYVETESNPQTWEVFSALFTGFTKQAGIIVFILIIGGAFWIVNSSKAIDAGIFSFLKFAIGLEKNKFLKKVGVNNIIIILIMLLFSLFGAVFGMSEETIAFVIIMIPLAISMGYDSIVGVCMVYIAAHVGFAGAFLNPFTIGIAQDIAGIPMFSGMEYRIVCWLILTAITIIFVLIYAGRIKRNPERSIMYEADSYWRDKGKEENQQLDYYTNRASKISFIITSLIILVFTIVYSKDCVISFGESVIKAPYLLWIVLALFLFFSWKSLRKSVHFYVLTLLMFTIVYLIIGILAFSWYITEISALFLGMAIAAGVAIGYSANNIVKEFLNGAKDIMSAALVVGLAAGIVVILQDGRIMDTILHSMAQGLGDAGKYGSLSLMYVIQTVINIVIPSASAKAAITMPIMAPFSDIIGVSRQATVLAFQFGDGFTNMITPTSGVLIAVLGIARIPYAKWLKWVWKFILMLIILGFILLLPTIVLDLRGF